MKYRITVEDTESCETYTTECDGVAMLTDRGEEWGSWIEHMSVRDMAEAMEADSKWNMAMALRLALALDDEDDGDEDDEDDEDDPSGRCAATSPCQGRQEERGDDGDE